MKFKEDLDPSVLHNQKETFVLLGVIKLYSPEQLPSNMGDKEASAKPDRSRNMRSRKMCNYQVFKRQYT